MDKMISIKGLVIRTTPVIPDMKTGMQTGRFKLVLTNKINQRFFGARSAITQSMYRLTGEKLRSPQGVLDKLVFPRILCKSCIIGANLQTSKS